MHHASGVAEEQLRPLLTADGSVSGMTVIYIASSKNNLQDQALKSLLISVMPSSVKKLPGISGNSQLKVGVRRVYSAAVNK